MIHLYYGEGKGKTSAAIGLSVRARGNGVPVVFVQFLKGRAAGEVLMMERLGVTVFRGKAGDKFVSAMSEDEKSETKKISDDNLCRALDLCQRICEEEKSSAALKVLLVLDEVCAAWNLSMVSLDEVESLVRNPPDGVELVLTGRNPPPFMLELSDYATELRKEKHPFDTGVPARKGIEF